MKPIYGHPLRPQFHFTPEANWLNDPNGMVFYEGEYHLFYQHHPDSTVWGPMHWGHAVSKDLVHWEHLPIALYPDHNGTVFSGSAVVDAEDTSGFFDGKAGLVAIYTQTEMIPGTDLSKQRQSIAYSKDNGRTWHPYADNPVLADERFADFRDPKVFWHEGTKRWIMVLAAGDRLCLYHSADLKEWTFASEFGAQEGSHDGVWECPDLFALPIEGKDGLAKWVMLVSIGDEANCPEGSRTQYFIGEFDGMTFMNDNSPETVLWMDHGRDNYAGVTWSDAGDRLLIGWMNNWKYANLIPTDEWRGAMTIPRRLKLRDFEGQVKLIQEAPEELRKLRQEVVEWQDERISADDNLLDGYKGELFEIEAEFELDTAVEFGFRLRVGESCETIVGYDAAAGQLFIDRTKSGILDFHPQFGCRHGEPLGPVNGTVKLHIWVDRSSVEIFADEGGLVMTDQLFPHAGSDGIELFAKGGEVWLRSLKLYPLKSIYAARVTETVGK
ncbi:glycoside hydrolase family 32 protein [Paenibacillus alkaliterrae]|uniref:glycoside hydrolase family 32 protein n=1 Tax=Paenibacillus alkaliterrae TaxID=320909 RepID=UPI001F1D1F1A|nr:glycoside hydrolase family 32 protein [Paenibacillus alkaliterrae]MCF2939697.1 glycoside hydrolase family 32 protein [Paenibacillus alkaliterrae]